MTSSLAALSPRADADLTFTFDDRHWRVRGLDRQLSCERLKVNLMVARRELSHLDTLDLYASRPRKMFVKEAAAELYVEEEAIKQDLGRVMRELEGRQEAMIRERLANEQPQAPPMSDAEREDALQLLHDPQLVQRILEDYDACGLVGEEANKLVCYLGCVSRLLPQPLAVLVQSSSAAGKTTLQDSVLRFMPPEQQIRLSTLTAQSLYYMGRGQLKHKILAVAEEDGAAEAAYALKLLQSEGRLSIAAAGKDSGTGRPQTQLYEVEGPVAMLLTTTAEEPDAELANRCLTLSANEQPEQTAAIHRRQRVMYTLSTVGVDPQAIALRHQHAQRLLEPLEVVMPWAERLTFRTDQTRYRRDHAKYLVLIASIALLHQYQRKRLTRLVAGRERPCVAAALEDLELANRLAAAVIGEPLDALSPPARRLLSELSRYVGRRADQEGIPPSEARFTQRQLREALQWQDRSLRTHLARLVELEYVLMRRTGRGNQRAYQLLGEPAGGDFPTARRLQLADVEQLRQRAPRRRSEPLVQLAQSYPTG